MPLCRTAAREEGPPPLCPPSGPPVSACLRDRSGETPTDTGLALCYMNPGHGLVRPLAPHRVDSTLGLRLLTGRSCYQHRVPAARSPWPPAEPLRIGQDTYKD